MKTDREIIFIYRLFKNEGLPQLNVTYECEKAALAKRNLFNKKKINIEIAELYSAYGLSVKRLWEQIYSNPEEFDLVMTRLSVIQDGKPALEKESDIGFIVEQFFSMCFFAVSALGAYYRGVLTKENSDIIHDTAIKVMNEKIDLMESKYGIKRIE